MGHFRVVGPAIPRGPPWLGPAGRVAGGLRLQQQQHREAAGGLVGGLGDVQRPASGHHGHRQPEHREDAERGGAGRRAVLQPHGQPGGQRGPQEPAHVPEPAEHRAEAVQAGAALALGQGEAGGAAEGLWAAAAPPPAGCPVQVEHVLAI